MKRQFRFSTTKLHILLITLLGTPLISPLLNATAVPCTHDGHLHYHRIAAMRHAWENGLFFTRWLPDLAFGYGYPFFVYREPAPLYAGLIPHLMGVPLPAAANLFYALCILSGGWFMYLWVRDLFGANAGIVSAVAYMAAPYVLVDTLIRGNSPESLALALFPLLMWAGRRWLLSGTAVSFLIATFGLALLSLSHNISTLLFTPTLLVYLGMLAWAQKLPWKTAVLRMALMFGLGLGMTIFYAGGALLELNQVTLEQSTVTRNNDFHYNFITLTEIFSAVPTEDPALVNPPLPFRLGWAPVVLAIVAIVTSIVKRKPSSTNQQLTIDNYQLSIVNFERRVHIWLMLAATAVFIFLSLSASLFFWENVPLVDFIQFPWRMVGRAALPLAFLAGVPFARAWGISRELKSNATSSWLTRLLMVAAIIFIVVETIPNLYPNTCTEEAFPTINTVHNYEHQTGLVGVDPEGSYFPRTVQKRPSASPLEPAYQNETKPSRLDDSVFPANTMIHVLSEKPLSVTAEIEVPEAFTAVYFSFDFPGWTAYVDGKPTHITPSTPAGLITFPVPAGKHTISVKWQSTPMRTLLVAISLFALAGTAVTAFVVSKSHYSGVSKQWSVNSPQLTTVYWLLITALTLIGAKWLIFDRIETSLRQT
ncbi:MAG: hypothetical protein GY943_29890, partial [Chloroflexi bacterium]|nr:hypothetical protein [Chloroflexota bacterium]